MKQIFKNPIWEELSINGEILTYGYYHRYWNQDGSVNPEFDIISGKILDLKEKKESALGFFFQVLNEEICDDITICVVPSHIASESNESGIAILASRLASENRINGVNFLLREKTVSKKAYGGDRNYDNDFNSIIVNQDVKITGSVILLVDDVTTSGNSLKVCKDILLRNGAERVAMFAIGRSI